MRRALARAIKAGFDSKTGPKYPASGPRAMSGRVVSHYEIGDTRVGIAARVESAPMRWLRLGAGARNDKVTFADVEDRVVRAGGDVTIDTRVDPAFPRNAVHATFGVDRLAFHDGSARQTRADVRGYLGLFHQTVLAVRGLSITTNEPLPAYEHVLLGGAANLRGYDAGYAAGDNLLAVSAELRVPVTPPLNIGRFGVKAFIDAGTVYTAGEKLGDQHLNDRGIGGGVYLQLPLIYMSLDVARSRQGDTQFHFGMGVTFK